MGFLIYIVLFWGIMGRSKESGIRSKCSVLMEVLEMSTYFEFEVLLDGVEPRVWRTFLLRSDLTFHELHDTIQKACGWENRHLYQFMEGQGRKKIC